MTAPSPGSAEWLRLISASKVAAVLGLSPWESPYSLWRKMRGDTPPQEMTKVMARGHYLEAGVLAWWRDQHPELTSCVEQHYATMGDWACATLDALATDEHGNTIVVEVKTAARGDEWGVPGSDEIPPYYAAQVLWQLALVPAAQYAAVAVLLGPGLELAEYIVERDNDLIAEMVARCHSFYVSLSADTPPDLDDTVATFESLRQLHPDIDGTDLEVADAVGREYLEAKAADEAGTKRARLAKSVLMDAMGNCRRATVGGVIVARRQPARGGVALHQVAKTLPLIAVNATSKDAA